MTSGSWIWGGAFTLAVGAIACSGDAGTSGALGNVSTTAHCAPSDEVCALDGLYAPLAVGARLPLSIEMQAKGFGTPPLTLVSASERVFGVEANVAIGRAPGFASLLILTPEQTVLDFVTLSVEKPTALRFHRFGKSGAMDSAPLPEKIQMLTGDDEPFAVKAYIGDRRLLGEMDATWTTNDLVRIVDDGSAGSRRVVARAPGTALLTVDALGLKTQITLEVLP